MPAADLVIHGATVETMTGRRDPADAVAIRDGRIVAVGAGRDLHQLAGPGTRLLELCGETLLPGFQDAHIHAIEGGLISQRCDLHARTDVEGYLAAIRRYAQDHPDREWILGGGWSMPAFPGGTPRREQLDEIAPHRPVLLENRDGHGAWVNSRALEIAAIDGGTPDPSDGRIERDEHGEPSGTLHEGAMALVARHVPPPSHEELVAALEAAQHYLHGLGITAWQDASVSPELLAVYRQAAERGRLSARVVASQRWRPDGDAEQIERFVEERRASELEKLRAGTVKIFLDGVVENFTAALIEPYLDDRGQPTANRGIPMVEPELLRTTVTDLDRLGFQVHFHAIGDAAVRQALDALEAARQANGPMDARHHIAHIQLIHPDDIPRFAQLGAVATMQAYWACFEPQMTELTIPYLGPERWRWQYPFGSLLRAGARLAAGSDWTVTTADPLLEIEVATRRVAPDDRAAEPFLPEQRLELDSALAAFTIGSAYVNRLEHETGSIEVGKRADLVVLDRDIRAADYVGDARVLLTLVDGAEVSGAW